MLVYLCLYVLHVSILLNLINFKWVPEGKCTCWACLNEGEWLGEI